MKPYSRRRVLVSLGAAASVSAAGCTGGDEPTSADPPEATDAPYDLSVPHDIDSWDGHNPDWEPPGTAPDAPLETEPIVENLEVPWDMEFAGNGDFFVSERVGRISRYEAGELASVTEADAVIDHADSLDSGGFDWWGGGSEGGLLGIALHPNYPDVPVLYAFYTYEAGGDDYRNRLVYYDLDDDYEETVLVDDIPGHRIIHNGARLAFGPRNYLWVTTGDADLRERAADPDSLAGKTLRLEPDGTAPADNPDIGDPRVYSYGHRNPQGITWLPDGTPLATEHGPAARDEVNVIEAGGNYGWPSVRGPPGDDEHGSYADHDDVTAPLVNTGTDETWAPCGCLFYTGDAVPALRNRLLVAGLSSQRLNVVSVYGAAAPDISGTRHDGSWLGGGHEAIAHGRFEHDLGRIRHVEQGPDGALYLVTSNRDGRSDEPTEDAFPRASDDRLVRVVQPE